jgi:hypothetical protein
VGQCGRQLSPILSSTAQNKSTQAAEIRSRRGIILSCSFTHDTNDPYLDDELTGLAEGLEGKRYGFIDKPEGKGRHADVWLFLKQAMDS